MVETHTDILGKTDPDGGVSKCQGTEAEGCILEHTGEQQEEANSEVITGLHSVALRPLTLNWERGKVTEVFQAGVKYDQVLH